MYVVSGPLSVAWSKETEGSRQQAVMKTRHRNEEDNSYR